MLFGESFERPPNTTIPGQSSYAWHPVISPWLNSSATIGLDPSNMFAGFRSQRIQLKPGSGSAGLANRGLGNEGLYLRQGMEYEGYFFAKSAGSVTLQVRLTSLEGEILAVQNISHPAGAEFVQHRFKLTPSKGADNKRGLD